MRLRAYPKLVSAAVTGLPRAVRRRETAIWLSALAVGAAAIAIVVWRLSIDLLPFALSAETRVEELRGLSVAGVLDPDSAALADLQRSVDQIEAEVRPASRYTRWLARFSPAVSWLPALNYEVAAWAAQADRLESDLESASNLIAVSGALLEVYSAGQRILLSPRPGPSPSQLSAEARDLGSSFDATIEDLTEASRAGKRHRGAALSFPPLSNAVSLLDDVEERMIFASVVGRQASDIMADLLEMGDRIQPVLGQLMDDGYEAEPLTAEEMRASLAEIDQGLQFALVKTDGLARLAADGDPGGPFHDRLELLRDVLGVLLVVSRATTVGLDSVEPVLRSADESKGGLLSGDGVLARTLDGIAEHVDGLSEALSLLADAQRTLSELTLRSDRSVQPEGLQDLLAAVNLLAGGLGLVRDIAPIGAELIGADSVRRYLVLGQSADEIRATGGYVSSIWLVVFENGGLASIQYHDALRVDDWERLDLYPAAPLGLEEHMNAQVWLLRDVSWEPDFPTVARTAADMYRIGQRLDVDGVVAINQWTLLALLEHLGSIPSPEGGPPITPRNLFTKLEQGSDEHGRAYMDLALQGILERLNEPVSLSALLKLASALQATLQSRDLLLFMDDPEAQAVISERAWGGRVRRDSADYLYVVDSNVGWSKADRNIERKVRYQVDLSNESDVRVKLTLGYNNHGGPGSPGCEPQWLNRGTNYSELKNACYWNFWRVYAPQGVRLLSNTPLTLPIFSVSAEIGKGQPGQDTVKVSSSYDRTVISGLLVLGAGSAKAVDLVYDLPSDVLRRDGDDVYYSLLIQKQPGARNREVSVEIIPPDGHHLSSSSIPPDAISDSRLWYSLELNRDTVLAVRFTGGDDGGR